jgi:DHA1 family tetracycline resistance protein-like MFS transporter
MKLSALFRDSEFWYTGYAFQAAVVFGTGGILMPIIVNNTGNAAKAGTVIAFFYIGQMLAPLIGRMTDRLGIHRITYMSGYVLLAIGLGLFPLTSLLWFWMGLAFVQGVGSGATNTAAAMFIVEFRPKDEWDGRIGWLQTAYGVGQCGGLLLVSVLQSRPELGLVVSAFLMVPGLILGSRKLPVIRVHHEPHEKVFDHRRHHPQRSVSNIMARYYADVVQSVRRLVAEWYSAYGLFILGWFFVMLATWLLGTLFPLVMKDALGVSYRLSSLYYALGAFIGIFAYAPSGTLGKKIGDGWVVIIGAVMTLFSLSCMTFLSYVNTGANAWIIPFVYIPIPIAWSPLMVGGTAWAAQLATFEEGEALGFFNAATAISSVISAFGAGFLGHHLGYGSVLLVGAVSAALAIACYVILLFTARRKG